MFTTLATLITIAIGGQVTAPGCEPSGPPGPLQTAGQGTPLCVQAFSPTLVNQTEDTMPSQVPDSANQPHPYVGMWVTGDGRIRQELLPNGRYDEARGARASAYVGRYEITGTSIFYWDDSGFTADGEFVDMNTLHHGGMIMYREQPGQ